MTKQELVDYCIMKIAKIKTSQTIETPEFCFYKDFFKDYSIKSVKKISEIPHIDIATAYLNASIKDKSFDEIITAVGSFSYIIEDMDHDDLAIVNHIINLFVANGNLSDLKESFSEEKKKMKTEIIFCGREDSIMRSIIEKLLELNRTNKADIYNFLSYYEEYPTIMDRLLDYLVAIKKIGMIYERIQVRVVDAKTGKILNDKEKVASKALDDKIKQHVNSKKILMELQPIEKYYSELCSKERSKKRSLDKEEKAYMEFINGFKKVFSTPEIRNYEKIIKDIPDEEVRLEFLKLVYEHNMEEYERALLTYNQLSKNSSVRYLALLQENGISKDEVRLSSIMKNSYEDVSNMLRVLKNLFDENKKIIKVLEISTYMDVLYIKDLMDKGVLNKESINTYGSIFSSNSHVRELLDKNINVLNDYSINPSLLIDNSDVLLDNELLESNLEILKTYDLLKYIKGQNNYKFLRDSNLINKIDKLLELGYESIIKEDITLLGEDNIDRLYVLKSIGVIPSGKEELLNYLRTDSFLVYDTQLDYYIHNIVPVVETDFKLDIDGILDEYDSTNRTICINGVILSKNRIRRNKSLGNFKSIITDSVLSMDEVDSLRNELKNKEIVKE